MSYNENRPWVDEHWLDLWFTLRWRLQGNHWMDWQLIQIISPPDGKRTEPLWQRRGAESGPDFVESLDEAEILLSGFLKWDGCMQWDALDQFHVDGKEMLDKLNAALARVWEHGKKTIPEWDD